MIYDYLKTFYEYIFQNSIISNLFINITICILAYNTIKIAVGGVKRWYKLFMIS